VPNGKEVMAVVGGTRERYLVVVQKGEAGEPEFDLIDTSGDEVWTRQFVREGVALFPLKDVERVIRNTGQ
jgi:hypothetical protein